MPRTPAYITYRIEDGNNEEVIIKFDATTSENHDIDSTITDKGVELDSDLTDHQRKDPEMVTLNVVISNTPIVPPTRFPDSVTASSGSIDLSIPSPQLRTRAAGIDIGGKIREAEFAAGRTLSRSMSGVVWSSAFNRIQILLTELNRLIATSQALSVVTPPRTYESMLLKTIAFTRSPLDSEAPTFALTFKNIRIASTRTVPTQARAQSRRQTPKAATRAPSSEQATQGQRASAAFNIRNGLVNG